MAAKDLGKALLHPDFVASKEVLVIRDALALPGFQTAIDHNALDLPDAVIALSENYPDRITLRSYGAQWMVSLTPSPLHKTPSPAQVEIHALPQLFVFRSVSSRSAADTPSRTPC